MSASTTISMHVPGPLRVYCNGAPEVQLSARNVRAAFEELERRYPALHRGICDETGAVRRHIGVFVNSTHVRDRDGLDTPLVPGDVVIVLPAVSGG